MGWALLLGQPGGCLEQMESLHPNEECDAGLNRIGSMWLKSVLDSFRALFYSFLHLPRTCQVATCKLGLLCNFPILWGNVLLVFLSPLVFQNFLPHTHLPFTPQSSFFPLQCNPFSKEAHLSSLEYDCKTFFQKYCFSSSSGQENPICSLISAPHKGKGSSPLRGGHSILTPPRPNNFCVGDKRDFLKKSAGCSCADVVGGH